jgi:hypothetical protein
VSRENLDTQQVEIIGRHWLVGELIRAGLEAAEPGRDSGVDLLVSPPDYAWTQPVQVKTHRDRAINVYPGYTRGKFIRLPLLIVYTLLGDSESPMPAVPEDVYISAYNDYSPRMLVLTPGEAWALPSVSGKVAYPDSDVPHRLSWTSLSSNGYLPDGAVAEHRGQILGALHAGRERRLAEMAAQTAQQQVQVQGASDICADDSGH